jgi:4-amino-4-deoxy-L-arabinose transferase-like glycosyltransferase
VGDPDLRLRAHFGSLALVFASLTAWSWRKWADVFIDYGMDLYIPWQLSQGRRLYRDISWLHGPLAQYFNTLLFKLTGPSITTLIIADLAITALLTFVIYRIFTILFDRRTALAVCVVFLSGFAFSQYTRMGSFNYIAPYRHEQTHGVVLAVVMVYCLIRLLTQGQTRWAGLAGLCLGLVALTKIEITLAAAAAAGSAFVVIAVDRFASIRQTLRHLLFFAAVALIPPLISIAVMATWLPWPQAVEHTFANFTLTWQYPVLDEGFYLFVTGLDAPRAHLIRMLVLSVAFVLLVVTVIALQSWLVKKRMLQSPASVVFFGLAVFVAALLPQTVPWQEIGLLLPVTTAVMIPLTLRVRNVQSAGLLIWSVFSLGMMAKTMLHVRLYHYGFTLAMPATLLLVGVCITSLPNLAAKWTGSSSLVRATMIGLIAAACVFHLAWTNEFYGAKTLRVGDGGDAILTYPYPVEPVGELIQRTIDEVQRNTPAEATVLVLPQGMTLNYLTRRTNGTPFWSFLPWDLKINGGEKQVLETIRTHPPDYVVLMHNGVPDFEGGFFGGRAGSGKIILDWLSQSYYQTWQVGALPFVNEQPGVLMLKRKPPRP